MDLTLQRRLTILDLQADELTAFRVHPYDDLSQYSDIWNMVASSVLWISTCKQTGLEEDTHSHSSRGVEG